MRWTTAISREPGFEDAIEMASQQVLSDLGNPPDLVFVFASDHYRSEFDALPVQLRRQLGACSLFGCSASGVIGSREEVEFEPCLSLTAATLPDVGLDGWHIETRDLGPGTAHSRKCADLAERFSEKPAQFIILADPFTFPIEQLLHSLEAGFPSAVIAGGLASGSQGPGETALFLNEITHHSGALILSLDGNLEMRTAVAQGCRPIGEPMFVTSGKGGVILELDGRPPLQLLNELYGQLNDLDRELIQHSLFIGIAMHPGDSRYGRGDFLIRNLLGADQNSGAIQVAAELHPRQVVQFHLRDAQTSADDLEQTLARTRDELGGRLPQGTMLFSCMGRGKGLYGQPGHDSETFHRLLGATTPLGGFFCNGEIGPVAGKPFLHGYTSSFALFLPRGG